ncbi:MAG: response regulator transcription factor [Propionibacteriaceae bacterium]|jgi:two-component system response regulator RegX3|nr:response regulator transcription factor [Propionibacteriaceae bacterium]
MAELLLVEDDDTLRETLAFLLRREGYGVSEAADGAVALGSWRDNPPDLILLDLMIPEVPGPEVCRMIRAESDVPIIMLTAKSSEADIVFGLESGADDYLTKPFSTPELLARIRSALRRHQPRLAAVDESRLAVGKLVMDVPRHRLEVDGAEVTLRLREFELLELLMRNAGRVLTRHQIIDRVWGADYFGDTKTLDVHVRRLRAKIEPDQTSPTRLITVRGLGYRLEESG